MLERAGGGGAFSKVIGEVPMLVRLWAAYKRRRST